jgi:hypothetical protein
MALADAGEIKRIQIVQSFEPLIFKIPVNGLIPPASLIGFAFYGWLHGHFSMSGSE